MKSLLYFVVGLFFILGCISVFWNVTTDATLDEQIQYIKSMFSDSLEDSAASNVSESASKLGKVLKNNFDEAQDVYENGAKYSE